MGRRTSTVVYLSSEDILTEIFYRLPSKSVFRFKCVSKSWLSLVSDPFFIRGYTSRASQPTQWTLLEKVFQIHKDMIQPCHDFLRNIDASRFDQVQPRLSELAFRSPKSPEQRSTDLRYEIAAVSNGFLLCRLYDDTYINNLRYCMINPITWQCFELSDQLPRSNSPVFAEGFLTRVDHVQGIVQRYVVVIPTYSSTRTTRHNFKVFSSETGLWRDYILESPTPFVMLASTISFGVNERIHWYSRSGWQSNDLVAYDPLYDYKSCRVIQFPKFDSRSTDCVRVLDAFEGCLRCIRSTEINDGTVNGDHGWEVWTLVSKFEEGGWTLVHRIAASMRRPGPPLDQFFPISNPADPNIFYFGSKHDATYLVSYNIKTRKCKFMDGSTVKLDMNRKMRNCPLFVLPPWPITVPNQFWAEAPHYRPFKVRRLRVVID